MQSRIAMVTPLLLSLCSALMMLAITHASATPIPHRGDTAPGSARHGHAAPPLPKRPNILFYLADDMGPGEVQAYYPGFQTVTPHGSIPTPRINQLATEGMRFSNAYTGAPICAASRCGLMTGLHTGHSQIRGNKDDGLMEWPLEANTTTLPRILQQAGYSTSMIGKWGLGFVNTSGDPLLQGWDRYYGPLQQIPAHNLYPPFTWESGHQVHFPLNSDPASPPTREKCMATPDQCTYLIDAFLNRTFDWLDEYGEAKRKADAAGDDAQPFFMYLAYVLPHAGGWTTDNAESGEPVPSNEPFGSQSSWPTVEQDHAAMIQVYIDGYFGKILDRLKEQGLDQDTLVVFASDNGGHNEGGHDYQFFNSSGQYRGFKRSLYEGGSRTPTIIRWPGVIEPNSTSDAITAFWDFLPTFTELAGAQAQTPQVDGRSMVPLFLGQKQPEPHEYVYFEFCTNNGFGQAVRLDNYKLVRFHLEDAWELYDLSTDIGEQTNLAASHPALVSQLSLVATREHVEIPAFPSIDCVSSITHTSMRDPIDQEPDRHE